MGLTGIITLKPYRCTFTSVVVSMSLASSLASSFASSLCALILEKIFLPLVVKMRRYSLLAELDIELVDTLLYQLKRVCGPKISLSPCAAERRTYVLLFTATSLLLVVASFTTVDFKAGGSVVSR